MDGEGSSNIIRWNCCRATSVKMPICYKLDNLSGNPNYSMYCRKINRHRSMSREKHCCCYLYNPQKRMSTYCDPYSSYDYECMPKTRIFPSPQSYKCYCQRICNYPLECRSMSVDRSNDRQTPGFNNPILPPVAVGEQNCTYDPFIRLDCIEEFDSAVPERLRDEITKGTDKQVIHTLTANGVDINASETKANSPLNKYRSNNVSNDLENCEKERKYLMDELATKSNLIEELKKQIKTVEKGIPSHKKGTDGNVAIHLEFKSSKGGKTFDYNSNIKNSQKQKDEAKEFKPNETEFKNDEK